MEVTDQPADQVDQQPEGTVSDPPSETANKQPAQDSKVTQDEKATLGVWGSCGH